MHNFNLRVADEVLEINGQAVSGVSLNKAYELLKSSTHLVVSVKCNFLGRSFRYSYQRILWFENAFSTFDRLLRMLSHESHSF